MQGWRWRGCAPGPGSWPPCPVPCTGPLGAVWHIRGGQVPAEQLAQGQAGSLRWPPAGRAGLTLREALPWAACPCLGLPWGIWAQNQRLGGGRQGLQFGRNPASTPPLRHGTHQMVLEPRCYTLLLGQVSGPPMCPPRAGWATWVARPSRPVPAECTKLREAVNGEGLLLPAVNSTPADGGWGGPGPGSPHSLCSIKVPLFPN